MAESHPLEEIVTRPGVYFNPQTEVLIVVDDSAELDGEIFNMEEFEGSDWVQISDEIAVDEERRDELLVAFQTHYHPGSARSITNAMIDTARRMIGSQASRRSVYRSISQASSSIRAATPPPDYALSSQVVRLKRPYEPRPVIDPFT